MTTDEAQNDSRRFTRIQEVRDALVRTGDTVVSVPGMATAAVAIVLRERGRDCDLLLIVRSHHPTDPWSGHVAFPGGRSEPDDATPVETAIRETREELGVDLASSGRLLGVLDGVQAVAEGRHVPLRIIPCVFELTEAADLLPNEEVAHAFFTPLEPLRSGRSGSEREISIRGQTHRLPGYWIGEHFLWGLTFRMLRTLLVRLDHQPLRHPPRHC